MQHRSLVVHLGRVAFAVAASMLTFAALVWLLPFSSWIRNITLFVVPMSIAVGYVPLWRWYPRDAYPIGLVFCPAMLFVLLYFYRWLQRWH